MSRAPFPIQPELTAITLAYRNTRFIADSVLPRVPVGTQEFKYLTHAAADGFTIPNTLVGRKGKVNEVEFSATETTSATKDYGLEDAIPQADIDNAPPNYNPVGVATELLSDLILLDRESRVATAAFNTSNYTSSYKATLSGTTQWSHASSDPVNAILTALDVPMIRPNKMVMGRAVWTKVRQHAKVVAAVFAAGGNAASGGMVSPRAFADLFELDEVLIGESFYNSAKPGQTATMARVWGKSALLFYSNPNATPRMGVTFGLTAQFGTRIAGSRPDPDIGLRGGTRVRVGEGVKELITCADAAYLFDAAVA